MHVLSVHSPMQIFCSCNFCLVSELLCCESEFHIFLSYRKELKIVLMYTRTPILSSVNRAKGPTFAQAGIIAHQGPRPEIYQIDNVYVHIWLHYLQIMYILAWTHWFFASHHLPFFRTPSQWEVAGHHGALRMHIESPSPRTCSPSPVAFFS